MPRFDVCLANPGGEPDPICFDIPILVERWPRRPDPERLPGLRWADERVIDLATQGDLVVLATVARLLEVASPALNERLGAAVIEAAEAVALPRSLSLHHDVGAVQGRTASL